MAKREKNMWFGKSKEEKARIEKGLELLAEKEQQEAFEAEKALKNLAYLRKFEENKREFETIREKISKIEIDANSDFESLYIILAGINNRLATLLGDEAPEGYPKFIHLPVTVLYCIDGDASSRAVSVESLAHNLKVHLEKNPEDIQIVDYNVYSEKFELLFLVNCKNLLSNIKKICAKIS